MNLPTRTRRASLRKTWLAIHLYLGLTLGLLFALTGLTGSALVFYLEIDEWLNPELSARDSSGARKSYQEIFQAITRAEPQRASSWRLEIPENPQAVLTARYYKPAESVGKGFAPLLVAVDPYTADVVSARLWGSFAMTWIYDLHYTLLFDHAGKITLAIAGAFLTLALLSGMVLWWPQPGKLKSALNLKRKAGKERLNYDLHKLNGVYGLPVLLLLALTGIGLELPEYVTPLLHVTPTMTANIQSQRPAGATPNRISLDRAVAIARQRFPDASLRWLETPDGENGAFRINFYQRGEPSLRFPKTNVWVDQYSGAVLHVHDARDEPLNEAIIHWLHPLHSGEAFGPSGRLLVFCAGLACPVLFSTGVIRRRQKQRAKGARNVAAAHGTEK